MDQLIRETAGNREMLNQIVHRTFTTLAPDQGTGPKVSRKYTFTSKKIFIIFDYFWACLVVFLNSKIHDGVFQDGIITPY